MGLMIAQSVYDFRIMREKGYRYVDKTDLLYPLVTRDGDAFYFISRPRRFGKSLMLSTLECIFRGKRELFKGLAIDKLDYDWAEYPILHFNFATMNVETLEAFKAGFVARVQEVFEAAKVAYNPALPASAGNPWSSSSTSMTRRSAPRLTIPQRPRPSARHSPLSTVRSRITPRTSVS